jgi:MFS family permease
MIGRFLTPDLMALYRPETFLHAPAGLHLYAYVANDPTNRTDRDGMSFWSFVGSVVGVVVGVIVGVLIVAAVVATGGIAGVLLGIGLALAASLLVTGVSYIVASNVDPNSGFGQFMRGFMIGFNAGMNGVLAAAIFGPVIGVAVGVINFLATFDGIAKNSVYQGILGWSSWLMPMSWGATGLGVAFYVVNLVVAGVTFQQWDAAKIDKLAIDWRTGSIVMVGGLVRGPTAFNMGNFVFMNPGYVDGSSPDRTYDAVLNHETGHTLAVAAFGTAFGIADLIGENVVGSGAGDYGEQIAESHANRPGRPTIPMWS